MTQEKLVIEQLKYTGKVSRNWAIKNYITRLSAIVLELKKEGWNLEGEWVKTDYGKDYVYKVVETKPTEFKLDYKPNRVTAYDY